MEVLTNTLSEMYLNRQSQSRSFHAKHELFVQLSYEMYRRFYAMAGRIKRGNRKNIGVRLKTVLWLGYPLALFNIYQKG